MLWLAERSTRTRVSWGASARMAAGRSQTQKHRKKKTTNESTKKTDDFTLRSQQRTARGGQHLEQQKNVHRRRGTD